MVQRPIGRRQLPNSHHVARHCRRRDLMDDGSLSATAFRLRPGEEYLSTNWLEFFHNSDRQLQMTGVRQALADKGFRFNRSSFLAVLNVGTGIAACQDQLIDTVRFIVLGERHDPSHTGIYGCTTQRAAAALAESVSPNEIYPAA